MSLIRREVPLYNLVDRTIYPLSQGSHYREFTYCIKADSLYQYYNIILTCWEHIVFKYDLFSFFQPNTYLLVPRFLPIPKIHTLEVIVYKSDKEATNIFELFELRSSIQKGILLSLVLTSQGVTPREYRKSYKTSTSLLLTLSTLGTIATTSSVATIVLSISVNSAVTFHSFSKRKDLLFATKRASSHTTSPKSVHPLTEYFLSPRNFRYLHTSTNSVLPKQLNSNSQNSLIGVGITRNNT
jgi:hypothetical protein